MIDNLLSGLITASQRTPLRGRGGYSNVSVEKQEDLTDLDRAEAEAADFERIFKYFHEDVRSQIANKKVLDFGSGYGGRSVAYVEHCGAKHVSGVEPFQKCVDAGNSFAQKRGLSSKVDFSICTQNNIPYPDATFDCAITFDVLEHVENPSVSLKELRRIIKPGGKLYAVFPLYRGAFSHHLDYITMIPGLHLAFSPDRLIRVTNKLLERRPDIKVGRHSSPSHHFVTGRPILPMLNGMGLNDFKLASRDWITNSIEMNSITEVLLGRNSAIAKITKPLTISEVFVFNVAATLQKPI